MKLMHYYLFLFLLPAICFSQKTDELPVKDPAKLIERVTLFSQKTNSITAWFIQVKEMSFMEETVTSSGRFYFQKEDRVRWEYTDPFKYAIIINGERMRIIDEGKQKDIDAGSSRMFREISGVMTGMVNGTLLTGGRFAASWLEADGYYKAELIPADDVMKDYLSKIELKLNKTDFSVDELKMVEKSGDYTIITFRNKKLNEKIPADIFRLD
jgi:outer membrane lipoprotein-sorting protein